MLSISTKHGPTHTENYVYTINQCMYVKNTYIYAYIYTYIYIYICRQNSTCWHIMTKEIYRFCQKIRSRHHLFNLRRAWKFLSSGPQSQRILQVGLEHSTKKQLELVELLTSCQWRRWGFFQVKGLQVWILWTIFGVVFYSSPSKVYGEYSSPSTRAFQAYW